MNTAADFLSRMKVSPIKKNIQTKTIEVNIQSTGIVQEERIYILPDDEVDKNQLW